MLLFKQQSLLRGKEILRDILGHPQNQDLCDQLQQWHDQHIKKLKQLQKQQLKNQVDSLQKRLQAKKLQQESLQTEIINGKTILQSLDRQLASQQEGFAQYINESKYQLQRTLNNNVIRKAYLKHAGLEAEIIKFVKEYDSNQKKFTQEKEKEESECLILERQLKQLYKSSEKERLEEQINGLDASIQQLIIQRQSLIQEKKAIIQRKANLKVREQCLGKIQKVDAARKVDIEQVKIPLAQIEKVELSSNKVVRMALLLALGTMLGMILNKV